MMALVSKRGGSARLSHRQARISRPGYKWSGKSLVQEPLSYKSLLAWYRKCSNINFLSLQAHCANSSSRPSPSCCRRSRNEGLRASRWMSGDAWRKASRETRGQAIASARQRSRSVMRVSVWFPLGDHLDFFGPPMVNLERHLLSPAVIYRHDPLLRHYYLDNQ